MADMLSRCCKCWEAFVRRMSSFPSKSTDEWQTRVDEPGFLIAAGNGPQYGHGMRLTHQAQMDDGLLDLCFVRPLSKLRLLRLFRVVYSGGHIGMKEVEYFRAAQVRIRTEPSDRNFRGWRTYLHDARPSRGAAQRRCG